MSRRRRTGRVPVDFTIIESFAKAELEEMNLTAFADGMTLQRTSSLHRRRDGTYTLVLNWKTADGMRLSSTYRGLRLERA